MTILQLTISVKNMRELLKTINLVSDDSVSDSEISETEKRIVSSQDERSRRLSRTFTLVKSSMSNEGENSISCETPEHIQTMFEKLAYFEMMSLKIHDAGTIELKRRKLDDEQRRRLHLTNDDQDNDSRTLGTYNDQQVWVEWKAYQIEAAGISASGESK